MVESVYTTNLFLKQLSSINKDDICQLEMVGPSYLEAICF
jgi:hypothetical protein